MKIMGLQIRLGALESHACAGITTQWKYQYQLHLTCFTSHIIRFCGSHSLPQGLSFVVVQSWRAWDSGKKHIRSYTKRQTSPRNRVESSHVRIVVAHALNRLYMTLEINTPIYTDIKSISVDQQLLHKYFSAQIVFMSLLYKHFTIGLMLLTLNSSCDKQQNIENNPLHPKPVSCLQMCSAVNWYS